MVALGLLLAGCGYALVGPTERDSIQTLLYASESNLRGYHADLSKWQSTTQADLERWMPYAAMKEEWTAEDFADTQAALTARVEFAQTTLGLMREDVERIGQARVRVGGEVRRGDQTE